MQMTRLTVSDWMAMMAFPWSLAALETPMAEEQMDQHAAVLRDPSFVELWRLRHVRRASHGRTVALACEITVWANAEHSCSRHGLSYQPGIDSAGAQ